MHIIIGTSGHIDHGKTTLVHALTGRSTDRLKEEIKRGISIDLGFTYFDLPSGKRAGIIDVPGHERFIRNMLAGATGVDIVLLTIAANEGVKPQTIEHVDILSYLDIKERLIVLTKCDLADDIMKELVVDDIRERLKGTVFDGAEIVEVDSLSGKGIPELITKIDDLSSIIKTKNDRAQARLNIDRVFSMKGFGTIVTGTLSEGTIKVGDELELYPKAEKAKIRSIQVHDETVEAAYAGQRTALNISNLRREDIERGDVLATPGTMTPTEIIDVKITTVPHTDVILKLWDRVRVYMGAYEDLARVVPLDSDRISPGESAFCQLRLEKTTVAKKNDKFVLRTFSPLKTIGGGIVLEPNPKKHGKADKASIASLKIKETGDQSSLIEQLIRTNGEKYTTLKEVCSYAGIDEQAAKAALDELLSQRAIYEVNKYYFHTETLEAFENQALRVLSDYAKKFPLRKGMPKEELKSKITKLKLKEFDAFIKILESDRLLKTVDSSFIALESFNIVYSDSQKKIKEEIEQTLESSGFSPPTIESLTAGQKERAEVLESLLGVSIQKLDDTTAMHKTHYQSAIELLYSFMETHLQITLAEFRDITQSSRKYAMLLLDDFDRQGITMRVGDARIVKSR